MTKQFTFKKRFLLTVFATTGLGLSTLACANGNQSGSGIGGNHLNSMASLTNSGNNTESSFNHFAEKISHTIDQQTNKVVALGFAGMSAFYQAMYQFDQNLANSATTNVASSVVDENTPSDEDKTNEFIKTYFQNFPNAMLSTSPTMLNASEIQSQITEQNQLLNQLTTGTPASDTLYSNDPQVIQAQYTLGTDYYIGPPKTNNDNSFNIAAILSPTAYTTTDLEKNGTVSNFMAFLTESYKNPADNLHLQQLQSYISSLNTPESQYNALYNFIVSPGYQQYQLAMRHSMLMQSIGVNNFEFFTTERTPSTEAVSGITDSKGNAISHPSPLQVEAYRANHRIDDPTWIQSLQNKSSTSLLREIAIEQAEIIRQNHQAHLDRERLIATMSALELQSAANSNTTLQIQAQKLNQSIDGMSNNSNDQPTAAPTSTSSNDGSNTANDSNMNGNNNS